VADNKVTLEFHAVGADQTAAEVKKVESAQANLSLEQQLATRITAKDLLTASERQVAEYDRMVAAGRKVAAQQAADFKPSFVASMKSMEDQVAVVKKAEAGMASYTAGVTHAAASTRNSSQALYVFSQGFEDLQYGMRGVLNNIPQLIFAMGGGAGLAGVISLAAVGGNALYRMFEQSAPVVDKAKEKFSEYVDKIRELNGANLDDAHEAIKLSAALAERLRDRMVEVQKAENAMATSMLDNAEQMATAEGNLNDLLGIRVDRMRELEGIAQRAEDKRKEAARQAIVAEQQKLQESVNVASAKANELIKYEAEERALKASWEAALNRMKTLAAERVELEKIAQTGVEWYNLDFEPDAVARRRVARSSIAAMAPEEALAKGEVEDLANRLYELNKPLSGALAKAEGDFAIATKNAEELGRAVALNIERIGTEQTQADLLEKSKLAVERGKALGEQINSVTDNLVSTNAVFETRIGSLSASVEDGKAVAEKVEAGMRDTNALIALVRGNVVSATGQTQQETLGMLRDILANQAEWLREIGTLKAQMNSLQGKR
jgi:hypothetical protein